MGKARIEALIAKAKLINHSQFIETETAKEAKELAAKILRDIEEMSKK